MILELKGIYKNYQQGKMSVPVLKDVNFSMEEGEYVAIMGPSGSGKTTLMNIIGCLDKPTEGSFSLDGQDILNCSENDMSDLRLNKIGFVFQSFHLLPRQSALANVELPLNYAKVPKKERRERALKALERVGLADRVDFLPNQLSGGQMQRVAIARALVNDPDILLADEPTGALDTQTSIQIMDLLKEISKDRLIIMVTHNPELATQYSTRIIRLLDGTITDDSNPYNGEDDNITTKTDEDSLTDKKSGKTKKKKTSMSFFTALSLSLNNLMTKKTRTILTAFAGSIGIIGIALILSISNGIQNYIDRVQRDTLSSYPIQLQKESVDVSSMIENMMGNKDKNVDHDKDKIYSNNIMTDMVNSMVAEVNSNNLKAFKSYLENHKCDVDGYISDIQYSYDVPLYIYSTDTSDGVTQLNPSSVMENMYGMSVSGDGMMSAGMQNTSVWSRLFDNRQMLDEQYDLIAGSWADNYNEVMLVVDENNEIDDYTLYSLGFKDPAEVKKIFKNVMAGNSYETEETQYTYDEVLDKKFKLVLPTDLYRYNDTLGIWEDASHDDEYMTTVVNNAEEVKIAGIIRKNPDAASVSVSSGVAYTKDLMPHIIDKVNETQIVKQQLADPEKDVFTGMSFDNDKTSISTLENNKSLLGIASEDNPSEIDIYAKDFDSKEKLQDFIKNYNDDVTADGRDEDTINYTDYVGILMSSVSTIITAISSVLIAFVAISLVVSSIMIGIITYISVLERTKEIGVLRSIGASKKDVSRVFNAETLIEGFVSGAMGIIITLILCIPANAVIKNVTDISNVAQLPVAGAVILVIISMLLTTIAGLIPAKMAAKKDPVVALRTE